VLSNLWPRLNFRSCTEFESNSTIIGLSSKTGKYPAMPQSAVRELRKGTEDPCHADNRTKWGAFNVSGRLRDVEKGGQVSDRRGSTQQITCHRRVRPKKVIKGNGFRFSTFPASQHEYDELAQSPLILVVHIYPVWRSYGSCSPSLSTLKVVM
jgi:hypothetical protein